MMGVGGATLGPGARRSVQIVLAGAVVGGGVILLFPNYTDSVVRVLLALAAATALLHLVGRILPPESLLVDSEFTGTEGLGRSPPPSSDGSHGLPLADLARLRTRLNERRRRIPGAPSDMPAIPAELVRILRSLLLRALEQDGLDPARGAHLERIRSRLGPESRAIVACPPLDHAGRLRTKRPDPDAVARVVHAVLDDLARMGPGRTRSIDPSTPTPTPTPTLRP